MDACSYAYQRVSLDSSHPSELVYYRGSTPEETMEHFLADMAKDEEEVFDILKTQVPIIVCDEGLCNLEVSNDACYICMEPFLPEDIRVTDHSHVTGKIRGNSHNHCNLQLREQRFLLVVFESLTDLDGRIIMQAVSKVAANNVKVIPKSLESFVSITVNKTRFLDFGRFVKQPLDDLIVSLRESSGTDTFKMVRANVPENLLDLVISRHIMCKDYVDCPERLEETELPTQSAFDNRISGQACPNEIYHKAQQMWTQSEPNSLGVQGLVINDVKPFGMLFIRHQHIAPNSACQL